MTRSRLPALCRTLVILLAALAAMATAASAASPQPTIEGVWSLDGGTVIVAPDGSGHIVGTVASPITFANCPHPAGQTMWTDLTANADGSYSGLHQWYHGIGANCTPLPQLGPTTFRVLTNSNGSTVLAVCFSKPGTTAPTIASDGTTSNASYGCTKSAAVAGVPSTPPTFSQTITMPPATPSAIAACTSRRDFKIHIREPHNDPFTKLRIFLGDRLFRYYRHGDLITSVINLRGLPLGTYTLKIRARTAAGFVVKGHRTYHTCIPKIL
jgi:hypothetical protein